MKGPSVFIQDASLKEEAQKIHVLVPVCGKVLTGLRQNKIKVITSSFHKAYIDQKPNLPPNISVAPLLSSSNP